MRQEKTSVLIVGGGPVGLTLAMDLAWRGIDVLVAETRYVLLVGTHVTYLVELSLEQPQTLHVEVHPDRRTAIVAAAENRFFANPDNVEILKKLSSR
jgi:thioredoxin reductase